jgi:hypothetical protein
MAKSDIAIAKENLKTALILSMASYSRSQKIINKDIRVQQYFSFYSMSVNPIQATAH